MISALLKYRITKQYLTNINVNGDSNEKKIKKSGGDI